MRPGRVPARHRGPRPAAEREEAHTSKVSFFDHESIQHHERYQGRRVRRGLFRTASGRLLNADVNAAYNILVKAAPEAFGLGRRGCVVQPVWLELPNRTSRGTNPALVS
jgi:putative transposase